jgi:hypothetical protein
LLLEAPYPDEEVSLCRCLSRSEIGHSAWLKSTRIYFYSARECRVSLPLPGSIIRDLASEANKSPAFRQGHIISINTLMVAIRSLALEQAQDDSFPVDCLENWQCSGVTNESPAQLKTHESKHDHYISARGQAPFSLGVTPVRNKSQQKPARKWARDQAVCVQQQEASWIIVFTEHHSTIRASTLVC